MGAPSMQMDTHRRGRYPHSASHLCRLKPAHMAQHDRCALVRRELPQRDDEVNQGGGCIRQLGVDEFVPPAIAPHLVGRDPERCPVPCPVPLSELTSP